jgi:dienelactone hydrolase
LLRFPTLAFLLLTLPVFNAAANAQIEPATPPLANPLDTRFAGVKEDFTSPALDSSTLKPATPLTGYINDYSTYSVELLQVQWRWGDPLDVYVIKPKGVNKPPVILYLYGYPSDTDSFKSEAWQRAVSKDGFAAVGFVSALTGHRYHDRPMKEWFVSELQECLAVSAHDVQMVLNYLATRGDLDIDRIGMFGEGSGATIGILASAVDSRIKALDAVDPWGDWPVWMASSPFIPADERPAYVKPEYLKKVAALDPADWLPKARAKSLRLQDATFDPTTPAAAKEKLRAAVPANATVIVYKTPEEFKSMVNGNKVMEWMHTELRALGNMPTYSAQTKP